MRPSRIQAIEDVHREGALHLTDLLRWFYAEVACLDELSDDPDAPQLCFKSGQIHLRIKLVDVPQVDSTGFRLVLAVPALFEAEEKLKDRRMPLEWSQGVDWVDRRIATLDPAGNRVELKQDWPFGML